MLIVVCFFKLNSIFDFFLSGCVSFSVFNNKVSKKFEIAEHFICNFDEKICISATVAARNCDETVHQDSSVFRVKPTTPFLQILIFVS